MVPFIVCSAIHSRNTMQRLQHPLLFSGEEEKTSLSGALHKFFFSELSFFVILSKSCVLSLSLCLLVSFYKVCPGVEPGIYFFGVRLFSLSIAAPQTTPLLRPHQLVSSFPKLQSFPMFLIISLSHCCVCCSYQPSLPLLSILL